ncbi:ABC transporter substrate-binding protein [uncultured Martelella sp.]|uniref:ABC transporter substrate-binding protein n=1 Tax=uncultured Martelella sp. TaxID=392331 RepID=UPI0029C6B5F4|nr:ABC transporter substrate-binding protein [uncultured Martelella sp.]
MTRHSTIRQTVCGLALATLFAVPAIAQEQAPMLEARVQSGELPPLVERLPDNPKVVEPFESLGQYGGEFTIAMRGPSDTGTMGRSIGYENLMRYVNWQPDNPGDDILPDVELNVAESVDVNEDGTEYVFHLREGMKWSDGEALDADDIMFWYDHVFTNEELFPSYPVWAVSEEGPLTAEKIDQYTVKFSYPASNGLLLTWLATPTSSPSWEQRNRPIVYPAHYLEQFHPDFNPDAEAEALAAGAQGWVDYFHAKADPWRNTELPTLHAWVVTQAVGEGSGEQVIAERNPYYFKVDTEGRQLPYIDRIVVDVITDPEVTLLRAANGTYDMLDSYIGFVATPENRGTFYDNRESGGYEFYTVLPNRASLNILSLNITHPDPVKREIFSNKDFRIALSHAINREEIIELVYLGQGRPYQVVERPESPLFDEEMATQYTEYDPELANHMLDELGYSERNGDGIRLGPDGEPIQITVDIAVVRQPWLDSAELIRGYWRDVGIDLVINTMERTALWERVQANQHDAAIWSASGGADTFFTPKYYLPSRWEAFYAVPWGQYFDGAPGGEKPTDENALRQQELFRAVLAEPDQQKRIEMFHEIMDIAKESFWTLGIMQPTADYGIRNIRLRNVPDVLMASTMYAHPGASNPEQYYFTDE